MRLLVNGVPFQVITADLTQTGYYGSSKFTTSIALYGDPAHPPSFWDGQAPFDVELQGGFLPPGAPEGSVPWQSMFMGTTDEDLDLDLDGGTIELKGRDYSAKLIDAKVAETFPNQTLAQIATTLAGRVGLTANVASSGVLAGQYYQIDHARTSHDTFSRASSYWELITYLAQQEGYDVWVDGKTLNVQPKEAMPSTSPVFTVKNVAPTILASSSYGHSCNVQKLHLIRRPALSKDIRVVVKSWGPKSKKMVQGSDGPTNAGQTVGRTFPGKTQSECQALARSIRADLGRQEKNVTFDVPGEFSMRPRQPIAVQGTNTSFDTTFYLSEVTRDYSLDVGFWQTVRARSIPPQSDQETP